ncbi:MAG: hypothetical protein WKF84_12330 [Pyrinomonadaceae bacterium]
MPQIGVNRQLWRDVSGGLCAAFCGLFQYALKASDRAGHIAPMIFQFVVVFHYWSWYVFSLKRMRRVPAHLVCLLARASTTACSQSFATARHFSLSSWRSTLPVRALSLFTTINPGVSARNAWDFFWTTTTSLLSCFARHLRLCTQQRETQIMARPGIETNRRAEI